MLKTIVSKSEFKAKALEYMRWVQDHNKTITITDNGNPVIQLHSISPKETIDEDLKFFRGTLKKYTHPMDPVGLEDWEALK